MPVRIDQIKAGYYFCGEDGKSCRMVESVSSSNVVLSVWNAEGRLLITEMPYPLANFAEWASEEITERIEIRGGLLRFR